MNAVLTFQQLVRQAVIVNQPACRLPQRRIPQRRLLWALSVKADVINQAGREGINTHIGGVLQRGNLIRAELIGDIHITLLDQQTAAARIGHTFQQYPLQMRLPDAVGIGFQHQRLQRDKLFDGIGGAAGGVHLQPAIAVIVVAGVFLCQFAVDDGGDRRGQQAQRQIAADLSGQRSSSWWLLITVNC